MSNYMVNENSFYNGISQQNPELRLDTQVEDAVNTKLSVVNGVEKRPSAGLLLTEDGSFSINCKGHELEVDKDNQFIMVFNPTSGTKSNKAFSTKGTSHKVLTQDTAVDVYLTSNTPDRDLRLSSVLSTTFITNKTIKVEMSAPPSTSLGTEKYLYFNNGVQQVERTVIVGGNQWDSTKKADNNTKDLVDDFITWIGTVSGYTGTRISDSVVKVVRDDLTSFTMTATDSYSDTTMKVAPVAGTELEALPPIADDGEIIKILLEDSTDESYYLEFDSESRAWFETVGPGTATVIDSSTMPHKIEYLEDTDGSATGTTGEYYFLVSRIDWAPRTTGSTESSPPPSFVDSTINDIFFFKSRLGFLSNSTVVCSVVDDIFNFWPKTVKEVLDDDPIDLALSSTRNVQLEYAEVFPESMAILGTNTQFSLHSDGKPFTSANATLDITTSYEISTLVKPKSVGSSLYMVVPRDSYSSVREYAVIPDTQVTDATDVAGHVPRLIPETIKQISVDASLGSLFLIDEEEYLDRYTIWNYQFYWQGNDKIQSAWMKWDLWFRPMAIGVFNSNLFIVGTEQIGNEESTVVVQLRLETKAVEVLNYNNTEPLIDRLELYPEGDVSVTAYNEVLLRVDLETFESVDFLNPEDLVLVDRQSGASGSFKYKIDQGSEYYLVFDLIVSNKYNFYLNNNYNSVGQLQIGSASEVTIGTEVPYLNKLPTPIPTNLQGFV